MSAINKQYRFLFFMFLLLSGCSPFITKSKINEPTVKYSKLEAQEYFSDDKTVLDDEMYFLDRRINTRNIVLDSLNILQSKRIIIIDKIGDNNGKRYEESYIFFSDKILEINYSNSINNETNYKVSQISKDYLEKNYSKDVVTVYDYFNKDSFNEIKGDISFNNFIVFYVTISLKNKVGYYKIKSSEEGYKVVKLNQD